VKKQSAYTVPLRDKCYIGYFRKNKLTISKSRVKQDYVQNCTADISEDGSVSYSKLVRCSQLPVSTNHPGVPSNELDNEAASTPVDTSVPIDEPSV